jgi:hypothetical protein
MRDDEENLAFSVRRLYASCISYLFPLTIKDKATCVEMGINVNQLSKQANVNNSDVASCFCFYSTKPGPFERQLRYSSSGCHSCSCRHGKGRCANKLFTFNSLAVIPSKKNHVEGISTQDAVARGFEDEYRSFP